MEDIVVAVLALVFIWLRFCWSLICELKKTGNWIMLVVGAFYYGCGNKSLAEVGTSTDQWLNSAELRPDGNMNAWWGAEPSRWVEPAAYYTPHIFDAMKTWWSSRDKTLLCFRIPSKAMSIGSIMSKLRNETLSRKSISKVTTSPKVLPSCHLLRLGFRSLPELTSSSRLIADDLLKKWWTGNWSVPRRS